MPAALLYPTLAIMKSVFSIANTTRLRLRCAGNAWGHSSFGRAPALHAGGREFDSPWLQSCKVRTFLLGEDGVRLPPAHFAAGVFYTI